MAPKYAKEERCVCCSGVVLVVHVVEFGCPVYAERSEARRCCGPHAHKYFGIHGIAIRVASTS
jgi:hypothetical protein